MSVTTQTTQYQKEQAKNIRGYLLSYCKSKEIKTHQLNSEGIPFFIIEKNNKTLELQFYDDFLECRIRDKNSVHKGRSCFRAKYYFGDLSQQNIINAIEYLSLSLSS